MDAEKSSHAPKTSDGGYSMDGVEEKRFDLPSDEQIAAVFEQLGLTTEEERRRFLPAGSLKSSRNRMYMTDATSSSIEDTPVA